MLNFSLKIKSQTKTADILSSFNAAHNSVIKTTAQEMEKYLKDILSVRVEGYGAKIIRSKAGEAPRMDSGYLRSGVSVQSSFDGDTGLVTASASAPYAKYLEYGTSNIAARPFLMPTLARFKEVLKTRIKNLRRAV